MTSYLRFLSFVFYYITIFFLFVIFLLSSGEKPHTTASCSALKLYFIFSPSLTRGKNISFSPVRAYLHCFAFPGFTFLPASLNYNRFFAQALKLYFIFSPSLTRGKNISFSSVRAYLLSLLCFAQIFLLTCEPQLQPLPASP